VPKRELITVMTERQPETSTPPARASRNPRPTASMQATTWEITSETVLFVGTPRAVRRRMAS
jgi:hypothetical protein